MTENCLVILLLVTVIVLLYLANGVKHHAYHDSLGFVSEIHLTVVNVNQYHHDCFPSLS